MTQTLLRRVFHRPSARLILAALTTVLFATVVVIFFYALTPSLRWDRGTLYVSHYVRRHLAALGAVLLNTINQALVASQVSAFWNQAVAGFLLLAAIAFDRFVSLRISHALVTRGGARGGA